MVFLDRAAVIKFLSNAKEIITVPLPSTIPQTQSQKLDSPGKGRFAATTRAYPPTSALGYVTFNARRACPVGATPMERGADGREHCPGGGCCAKTRLEEERWEHQVRGRCWVIRDTGKR